MARAFLLAVLAVGTRGEERRFNDAEVAASQRYFMVSWRDQFNLGHAEYCGHSYVLDAALHVSLGPAAAELGRLAGFSDPMIVRGKQSIVQFWNTTQHIAGLSKINSVEDQGEYAATSFVVDDDHVIVSGRLAFDAVLGQTLSQEWVRVGDDDWKIKSDMIAFQELRGPLGQPATLPAAEVIPYPAPPTPTAFLPAAKLPAAAEPASEPAAEPTTAPAAEPAAAEAIAIDDRGRPVPSETTQAPQATVGAVPQSGTIPSEPNPVAKKDYGEDFLIVMGFAAVVVLAFMYVRRNQKREAAIAGFDSMLG